MPTDDHVLELLDGYLHDTLTHPEAQRVARHCADCATCRAGLEEARRRLEALESLPPIEASEQLIQRTVEHVTMTTNLRSLRWRRFRQVVSVATAAAVLLIAAVNGYFYQLAPSPTDLRILGQSELLAGTPASLRLAVFDIRDNRPLAGVPITLSLVRAETRETVELAQLTTDEQGNANPQFQLPEWDAGTYELRVVAAAGGGKEVLSRKIELTRSWQLMLSTDKPVYQPGQTIHLRTLGLRRPDLKPVAGEEILFQVTDPAGNLIFKQRDLTSRFGMAAVDCPLATEILEGPYQIESRVGDTVSRRTVEVRKYVLPKFKVEISLDRPYYGPGEVVRGSVQADYFFGKPVAGGKVELDFRAIDLGARPLATQSAETDAAGRAEFEFTLPGTLVGRAQDGGAARVAVAATVVDTAGQTYTAAAQRLVTDQPITLEVIPEGGTLVKQLPNRLYLFTRYADGRPARARVVVHGEDRELTTNQLGLAVLEVTPKEDRIGLTFKATDSEGRVGRRHVDLTCGRLFGDFLLRTDRAVYDGGETITLTALGGGVEPIFLDLLKDGQTMLTDTLPMAEGRGETQMELPAELFGSVTLVAYRFNASGSAVRKSQVLYIRPAGELQISATLDAEEYRPGAAASIRFKLTDEQGEPVPGALSLAAVDEAVFSVLNQTAGLEQTFFLLDRELLEPVYAIYGSWMPNMAPPGIAPEELAQFEQAIFSRAGGPVATGEQAVPGLFRGEGNADGGGSEPGDAAWDAPAEREFPLEVADPGFGLAEIPAEDETDDPGDAVPSRGAEALAQPFSLTAASYSAKARDVRRQREAGLRGALIAWCSLAGALVLVGLAAFAIARPRAFVITGAVSLAGLLVLGCAGLLLAALLLPAVQSARMAARDDMAVGAAPMAAAEWLMEAELGDLTISPEEIDPTSSPETGAGGSAPPRIRRWFPETLLWRPELITDENGEAVLTIDPLADSITTWRLSGSAVSAQGRLGAGQWPIRVFQPFFVDVDLPVALTRNDEVGVPLVVYNYLDRPQTVVLEVAQAEWFECLPTPGPAAEEVEGAGGEEGAAGGEAGANRAEGPLTLELGPNEIRALHLPIRVLQVGVQELAITARGGELADAVIRTIEVLPDGRREELVESGSLDQPVDLALEVPAEAIPGSARTILKLYPSTFSQLVEGLDNIFQMPYGCFEQTSSTTYPNVLALEYLRQTNKSVPGVEAKAKQYIHLGYQRLVSFEVRGGGFDWFGNPPANRTLTAYGLLEFQDMARVHNVDPELIRRTREWLLAQRRGDGSWPTERGMLDDGLAGSVQRGEGDLATTAYIAWAVFLGGAERSRADATLDFLLARQPSSLEDPYLLALAMLAIGAIEPRHESLPAYAARLDALKQSDASGKKFFWRKPEGGRTTFYGSGPAGDIETTATAALALLETRQQSALARGALAWLVEQKDARGTWHSTQATVLALKALIAGTSTPLGEEQPRRLELALGGEVFRTIDIAPDQAEVMLQIDLSELLTGGRYQLTLRETTETGTQFQLTHRYHVPEGETSEPAEREPLAIEITYDRERLAVDETVTALATVVNQMPEAAPMVILDLPIPGGFTLEAEELDELQGSGLIAKYQRTPRQAIVYLRALAPGEKLELRYRLRASMPVKVTVPAGAVYEYYNPARRGESRPAALEAT